MRPEAPIVEHALVSLAFVASTTYSTAISAVIARVAGLDGPVRRRLHAPPISAVIARVAGLDALSYSPHGRLPM